MSTSCVTGQLGGTIHLSDSHVNIVPLHDAAQVLVRGEYPMEPMVVDIGYDHLRLRERRTESQETELPLQDKAPEMTRSLTLSAGTPERAEREVQRSAM